MLNRRALLTWIPLLALLALLAVSVGRLLAPPPAPRRSTSRRPRSFPCSLCKYSPPRRPAVPETGRLPPGGRPDLVEVTAAAAQSPEVRDQSRVTLAAVGDVLLAAGVGRAIRAHGPGYPFARVKSILGDADIAVFNLECTLSRRGYPARKKFTFRADPSLSKHLRDAGLDVAVMANNHTLDFGRTALLDTLSAVRREGIVPVGAGRNLAEARSLRVLRKNGLRIGFLAFADMAVIGSVGRPDQPGIEYLDSRRMSNAISAAAKKVDILVASFHWGSELDTYPTKRQRLLARKAVDAGADLVIGHHPHVLQPVGTYNGAPIAYSLGNFVFSSRSPLTRKSAILVFSLDKDGARLVRRAPVRIVNCRPVLEK